VTSNDTTETDVLADVRKRVAGAFIRGEITMRKAVELGSAIDKAIAERASAQPPAHHVQKGPAVTTATDILNLAGTITGRDLHALGAAWDKGQPASSFTDRVWELNTTAAFELWDGIGHAVLSRIHWAPEVSDGLLAMRYAALALAARDRLTPFEFASLAGPWESVMGPLPAAV
jgi:hypothetical protein